MNNDRTMPIAQLTMDQLEKIKTLEEELRQESEDNIVLIAYDETE